MKEKSARNLYSFAQNRPSSAVDYLGLFPFCNSCTKVNDIKILEGDWVLTKPDWTPAQVNNWKDLLHDFEDMDFAANIFELAEGNPSLFFPKPDLSKQNLFVQMMQFQPTAAWGRIKYKVCLDWGPRFWWFGTHQLAWSPPMWFPTKDDYIAFEQSNWVRSQDYIAGIDAVDDAPSFMLAVGEALLLKYQDPNALPHL